jgi:hypothetical protein
MGIINEVRSRDAIYRVCTGVRRGGFSLDRLIGGKICVYSWLVWAITTCSPVVSQTPPEPLTQPIEIELLQPKPSGSRKDVVRGDRISPIKLQVPSLWWTKEQFDPFSGRLISNWLVYTQEQGLKRRVDILVNFQLWGLLDYIERYTLVNKFGTVGREYGYNIRIFNNEKELLAAYTCNSQTNQPICALWIEPSIQDSLRRRPKSSK